VNNGNRVTSAASGDCEAAVSNTLVRRRSLCRNKSIASRGATAPQSPRPVNRNGGEPKVTWGIR